MLLLLWLSAELVSLIFSAAPLSATSESLLLMGLC